MDATHPLQGTHQARSLSGLARGERAVVSSVCQAAGSNLDDSLVLRLAELGFLPGESVQLVRRGPGGVEPLAVRVGETLFALRRVEADCVQVI